MNNQIIKMIMGMLGPDKINGMMEGITTGMIEYKNKFDLQPGEVATRIVIFDFDNTLYAAVVAVDENENSLRQIESHKVTELITNLLKKANE